MVIASMDALFRTKIRILLNSSLFASSLVIETSHLAWKAYPVPIMSMIESGVDEHARARIPISQLTFEFNGVWRTDKKEGSPAPITERGRRNSSNEGGETGVGKGTKVGGTYRPAGRGGASRGRPVGAWQIAPLICVNQSLNPIIIVPLSRYGTLTANEINRRCQPMDGYIFHLPRERKEWIRL